MLSRKWVPHVQGTGDIDKVCILACVVETALDEIRGFPKVHKSGLNRGKRYPDAADKIYQSGTTSVATYIETLH